MHVLWISDSPDTPSGFGNVTRFVCAGLARLGHRVSILGWQAHESYEWQGCKVFPVGSDPLGSDAMFGLLVRHRPDAVIALGDVWWLPFFNAPHVRRQMELTKTPWLLYFPIDGDTEQERLPASWIEVLREVDVPIAMSLYGQRVAQRCGIASEYIPHGVDLDIFSPPVDRAQAKARVDAAGKFLVLSDSRNQPRKLLPRLLDVFARFAAGRPDALLHLHTDPDDEFAASGYYSYDLRADIRHLGLESQVRFSPGFTMKKGAGLPLTELAAYYQAADVHLLASSGEGFGLPTLQAAAAGAVPMASAYSASQELVEGHGAAIRVADWTENEFGIRRALIDIEDAAAKLARYYEDEALLQEASQRSRQFALGYGWEEVVKQWDRLLHVVSDARRGLRTLPSFGAGRTANVTQQILPSVPGVSVTVKMVERELGKLEASIAADAREHGTDFRLPTVTPGYEAARLAVPRRPGYIGVSPLDVLLFRDLKNIFPVLCGWVPAWSPPTEISIEGLEWMPMQTTEDARYELAQSVLLLNVGGQIPEDLLADAARFGVLCIGTSDAPSQVKLWPSLVAEDTEQALKLGRELLTDAARAARLSSSARQAGESCYPVSLDQLSSSLRRLHSEQWKGVAAAG